MEKKQTRRESRETAFLTAFAATFEPETPLVPAETESAVELVKKYGADNDYQFVNGLLGAVARERGDQPADAAQPQC